MRKKLGLAMVLLCLTAIAVLFETKSGYIRQLFSNTIPAMQTETGKDEQQSDSENAEKQNEGEAQSAEAGSAYIPKLTEAFDVYCTQILENCTEYNTWGYAVDDSFILWFYCEYGEEITAQLAEKMEQESERDFWYSLTGNTMHVLWLNYSCSKGLNSHLFRNVYFKDAESSTDIVMDFAGDVNFDEDWPSMADAIITGRGIVGSFSESLVREMRSADIMMLNNECTYGPAGSPLEGKAYTFQAEAKTAAELRKLGVDMVSLANNHTYDYGAEGLLKTLETLEELKMPYVGAGRNLKEAEQIVYFVINGKKIAIASATQIERTLNYTKQATDTSPGVLKTLSAELFLEVIKTARKNADYVIAFVHWGTEDTPYFESDQVSLGHRYIDAGADAVIGGHTHCLQGAEYYRGKPIIYSTGNFWFDWETPGSEKTGIIQLTLHEDDSVTFRFLPCIYEDYKTRLIEDASEKQEMIDYLESISDNVQIDSDGIITEIQ